MVGVFCSTYALLMCHLLLGNMQFATAVFVSENFKQLHLNGYKLRSDLVNIEITKIRSLIQCASNCVQRGNYRTISWNAQEKICWLGVIGIIHESEAENRLQTDAAWITLSRKEYTVYSIKYKDASRVNGCDPGITFDEANAVCHSRQTSLASPSDLLYSKSLGFSYKRCCWLSNKTVGYVVDGTNTIVNCLVTTCPWIMCVF